jgi:hypothetical protein
VGPRAVLDAVVKKKRVINCKLQRTIHSALQGSGSLKFKLGGLCDNHAVDGFWLAS